MSSADLSLSSTDAHRASAATIALHSAEFDAAFEAKMLAITSEYFPGPFEVEETFDPQEPEEKWRVIVVKSRGSVSEIQAAKHVWRERILKEFGPEDALRYTLFVLPQAS